MLDATPDTASNLALRIQSAVATTPLATGQAYVSMQRIEDSGVDAHDHA
jgi:hypothetical protein